ncbi:hypothetical protein DID74_02330, partial [Candidatus Marinamargulisbacteria bacterium SCGC AG-333-B06]
MSIGTITERTAQPSVPAPAPVLVQEPPPSSAAEAPATDMISAIVAAGGGSDIQHQLVAAETEQQLADGLTATPAPVLVQGPPPSAAEAPARDLIRATQSFLQFGFRQTYHTITGLISWKSPNLEQEPVIDTEREGSRPPTKPPSAVVSAQAIELSESAVITPPSPLISRNHNQYAYTDNDIKVLLKCLNKKSQINHERLISTIPLEAISDIDSSPLNIFLEPIIEEIEKERRGYPRNYLAPYKLSNEFHWNVLKISQITEEGPIDCCRIDTNGNSYPVKDDVFHQIKSFFSSKEVKNKTDEEDIYKFNAQRGVNCGLISALIMNDQQYPGTYASILTQCEKENLDKNLREYASSIVETHGDDQDKNNFCKPTREEITNSELIPFQYNNLDEDQNKIYKILCKQTKSTLTNLMNHYKADEINIPGLKDLLKKTGNLKDLLNNDNSIKKHTLGLIPLSYLTILKKTRKDTPIELTAPENAILTLLQNKNSISEELIQRLEESDKNIKDMKIFKYFSKDKKIFQIKTKKHGNHKHYQLAQLNDNLLTNPFDNLELNTKTPETKDVLFLKNFNKHCCAAHDTHAKAKMLTELEDLISKLEAEGCPCCNAGLDFDEFAAAIKIMLSSSSGDSTLQGWAHFDDISHWGVFSGIALPFAAIGLTAAYRNYYGSIDIINNINKIIQKVDAVIQSAQDNKHSRKHEDEKNKYNKLINNLKAYKKTLIYSKKDSEFNLAVPGVINGVASTLVLATGFWHQPFALPVIATYSQLQVARNIYDWNRVKSRKIPIPETVAQEKNTAITESKLGQIQKQNYNEGILKVNQIGESKRCFYAINTANFGVFTSGAILTFISLPAIPIGVGALGLPVGLSMLGWGAASTGIGNNIWPTKFRPRNGDCDINRISLNKESCLEEIGKKRSMKKALKENLKNITEPDCITQSYNR